MQHVKEAYRNFNKNLLNRYAFRSIRSDEGCRTGNGTARFAGLVFLKTNHREECCIEETETYVVVPVVRHIVVAVGYAAIVSVVVPRAATYDAIGAGKVACPISYSRKAAFRKP